MRPRIHFREQDSGTKAALCSFLIFALVAWALLSASFSGTFAADSNSRVKAAQSALKREQYLFEEPTGTLDDATRAALRRFQIRHGLPPTEELDAGTWQALQGTSTSASDAAAESADAPKAAVPGVPAATVESDQQFLKQVQASGGNVASEAPSPPKSEPATASKPKQLAPPPIAPSAALGGTVGKTASAESDSHPRKPLPPIAAAPSRDGNSQAEKPKVPAKRHQVAARDAAAEPAPAEAERDEPSATPGNRAREESVKPASRPVASSSDGEQDYEGGVEIQRSRVPEKRRQVAAGDVEAPTAEESRDESVASRQLRGSSSNSVPEPERRSRVIANAPSDAPAAPADTEIPQNAPPGSRITTYTTRTTGSDGRTTVERRTVVTPPAAEYAPVIRRVEPVERSREGGFFHRLFHGD
jgi:hypothetical protein